LRKSRTTTAVPPKYVYYSPSSFLRRVSRARAVDITPLLPHVLSLSLSLPAPLVVGPTQNPGRVVTLVHQEDWTSFSSVGDDPFPHEDVVWGVAFTIDPAHAKEVRAYLDHREKDGYTLERVDVYGLVDGVHETVVIPGAECYVGRNDNPSFARGETLRALTDTIWRAVGPSGPNKDYVYNLAAAIRALAPEAHDSHLFALEAGLRELDRASASIE